MRYDDFDFGPFLPDLARYKNPGLIEANNVYASGRSYSPMAGPTGTGATVTGEVRGARRYDLPDGTPVIAVGTVSDLFLIRGGTVYASSLSLTLSDGDYWVFETFGFSVYASCRTHGLYRLASIFSDNTFAASAGSPPKASAMDAVGDFLMLGNLVDIDATEQPFRIRWSPYNNPTGAWVTDIATQSDFVDMPSRYGEVTGIFGGRFDLIFQRNAISRIFYSGGPSVFAKEVIEDERGCPAPQSIVRVGGNIYFVSADGFCRSDSSGVDVISSDRVWSWFTENLSDGYLKTVNGGVDWANRSIVWSFRPVTGSGLSRQLIYNWGLDRFTTASVPIDWPVETTSVPVTIDETDPTVTSDDTLDVDGPSFDAAKYESGGRVLGAMIDGELSEFNGDNLEATFETGDFQPRAGRRSFISEITPIIENASNNAEARLGRRETPGEAKTYTTWTAQGSLGFCPVASDARYQSLGFRIPAGTVWDKASGFQVGWSEAGK